MRGFVMIYEVMGLCETKYYDIKYICIYLVRVGYLYAKLAMCLLEIELYTSYKWYDWGVCPSEGDTWLIEIYEGIKWIMV